MKYISSLISLTILIGISPLAAYAGSHDVTGDYYESCACDVICPCLFGGSPSQAECLGQGLLVIKSGVVDGVDLSGIVVHSAFKMAEWEKYTVSKNASDEQLAAVKKVIKAGLNFGGAEIVGIKRGKIAHDLSESKVSFSTGESELVMEMIAGADGSPMRLDNHPMFPNYRVYRSVTNSHSSDKAKFAFSGTNGLIADKLIHMHE